MKGTILLKEFCIALLMSMVTLTVCASAAGTYDPVGTWEYSAPNVAEGYTEGEMIIMEKDDGYRVVIVLNEYSQREARDVEFDKQLMTVNF